MDETLILVTGGGGFIGSRLVGRLLVDGQRVRAVDNRPVGEWYQTFAGADNRVLDLRLADACLEAADGASTVFNLASDMGGMGFIEANKALCMLSVLINTHMLQAAVRNGAERYFFSSSACVYAASHQLTPDIAPLKESDAYPAEAEDGYGWEKLFSERMCRHFAEDFGLVTRVARSRACRTTAPRLLAVAPDLDSRSARTRCGTSGDLPQGRRPGPAAERRHAQLHVHRRLPRGHVEDHGKRHRLPYQPGLERDGHDQPSRRHGRGRRWNQASAQLQLERAKGGPGP
jgi:hypothetical protein